tara:strand:- start:268 stop:1470 length:1203 start_codon:yes stop_codon:yes gene_type:complete
MQRQLGTVRREAWGQPDLTANPFLSLWEQSARLYATAPEVTHPDSGGAELIERVADAGLWPLMQRVQRDTLALREMALRVTTEGGDLVFRPVFPDMAEATSSPRRPSVPLAFAEWEQDPRFGWVRLEADVRGRPSYTATTTDNEDVTVEVLGTREWQYTAADDSPVLPYSLYHAAETGWLWDPYTLREVVEGALNIGLLLTFYQHIVRNASWPQRYAAGVLVKGRHVAGDESASREEVTTDPASLLLMGVAEDSGQPIIGQWGAAADPEVILRSVAMYERRILLLAGLHPPDVTRQQADIRSGYSLAVARESIREQQRLFAPAFRKGDLQTLRLCAVALNSAEGTSYPESGYQIHYRGLPPSPVEDRAKREHVTELLDRGVITAEEARSALSDVISRLEP